MESLSATKNELTLTVVNSPERGRMLQGRCVFSEFNEATRATVELGLISRKYDAWPAPEPWLAEWEGVSTRATVKPGPDGRADFELPFFPGLAAFKGKALEIAVVAVARSTSGTTLRIVLDKAAPPSGARFQIRGLPSEHRVKKPLMSRWLALLRVESAVRWQRLGDLLTILEQPADGPVLRVRVKGGRANRQGRARLTASEYVYGESSLHKYDPVFTEEAAFHPSSEGGAIAEFNLPSADRVPPSLHLKRDTTRHGILWELRLELASLRGGTAVLEIPITVDRVFAPPLGVAASPRK